MIKSCISLGLVLSLAVVAYGFPQGGPPPPSALAGKLKDGFKIFQNFVEKDISRII
jgi:hypothetical protein